MVFEEKKSGWLLKTNSCLVFFGNRFCSIHELTQNFSGFHFHWLKQIHSAKIIERNSLHSYEADGHWTSNTHEALGIKTADCLPVFLAAKHTIWALHAGWRGLASGIITRALSHAYRQNDFPKQAFIGPHIRQKKFEVGREVAKQLNESLPSSYSEACLYKKHPEKKGQLFYDLTALAKAQLYANGVKEVITHWGRTYQDSELLDSYRRQGSAAGRQYSFIARCP